ncbi:MAG: hypothetical protein II404_05250, partial [Prevotella sp.]|nr:hypothetical protein [Prevotella sp.]
EKTTDRVDDVFSKAFGKRKETFRQECLALIGEYDAQQVTAVAQERQQADLQREAETERSKKEAGGLDEAIANNPTGILAHVMRERQKREAKEQEKSNKQQSSNN